MAPPDPNLSPLATQITPKTKDRIQRREPWGFLVHTSGRGIVAAAKKRGQKPIEIALDIYIKSQDGRLHPYKWGGPTYVLDHDGRLYQICPDDIMTAHAGGSDRQDYLSGAWTKQCSPAVVKFWKQKWPGYKSPQHLYPTASANSCYVGIEMIPVGAGFGTPMRKGLLFTQQQHDAVALLGLDLAARHGWPDGWHRSSRLLGHEDVQPIERHDAKGGWDPGWLREAPYFDFDYVKAAISASE